MERDDITDIYQANEIYFNSHAHVERDEGLRLKLANFCNFNSHAHVERDQRPAPQTCGAPISTHTLTWSVTSFGYLNMYFRKISTHTLTWSVTKED